MRAPSHRRGLPPDRRTIAMVCAAYAANVMENGRRAGWEREREWGLGLGLGLGLGRGWVGLELGLGLGLG